MSFQCSYCTHNYSGAYALKRHISDKHPITEDYIEIPQTQIPVHKEFLEWTFDDLFLDNSSIFSDEDQQSYLVR